MAKFQIVDLGDCKITIHALSVRNIRTVIANIKEVFDEDLDVAVLMGSKLDVVIEVISEFIVLKGNKDNKDMTLEDLTPDDIKSLIEPFKEVNSTFLEAAKWAGLNPAMMLPAESSTQQPLNED